MLETASLWIIRILATLRLRREGQDQSGQQLNLTVSANDVSIKCELNMQTCGLLMDCAAPFRTCRSPRQCVQQYSLSTVTPLHGFGEFEFDRSVPRSRVQA